MQRNALPSSLCVRNVSVWNADGTLSGQDVFVEGGRIEAIVPTGARALAPAGNRAAPGANSLQAEAVIDGHGLALMPAGVDPQVHLRVPGQPEKETPLTGLRACVRGAYAAILNMPNTRPVIDSPESLRQGREEVAAAAAETGVDVLWSAAATMGQAGQRLVDFDALAAAGIAAFTDDGKGVASDALMEQAFAALERLGIPFLQHAEVPGHGGALAPGPAQKKLGIAPYPAEAEWRMVERDLAQLRKHPRARYHVLHVSTKETVNLLRAARREGLRASGEASPHHLLLTVDDIPADDSSYKMNPPLRAEEDRLALLAALASGEIDFVATDHAPHEPGKKTGNFAEAAFGTTGLETSLRVLLHLRAQGKLSAERLVSAFSTKPAEFLGIGDRYGALRSGRPFHAALIDPDAGPTPIAVGDLESLSKNNCFLGRPLAGRIVRVFQPRQSWTI
jgi:dihydroorotase